MTQLSLRDAVRAGAVRLSAKGIDSADLDSRALLGHVLGLDAAQLAHAVALGSRVLSSEEAEHFDGLLTERERRIPLQHLTGESHFRTLTLRVGPGVFVPRPETELLVELAIATLPKGGRLIDLCTGSGAIPLSIKAERPDATVMGVELAPEALAWAALNRDALGLDVDLVRGDATDVHGLPAEWLGRCDVVTANPPYIPTGAVPVDPEVRDHDPDIALYGGSVDGLAIPLRVATVAAMLLRPGGTLVMEHADTQGDSLPASLMTNDHWVSAVDHVDLSGKPRHTVAVRAGTRRERHTARILPVRPDGRVLLLHGWAPEKPDEPYWFTVGGALEVGEDARAAATRELWEEGGIEVDRAELTGPIDGPTIEFTWSGTTFVQHQQFFVAQVPQDVRVSLATLDHLERDTIDAYGWFTPEELEATGQAGHPTLPGVLAAAIALRRAERPPSP